MPSQLQPRKTKTKKPFITGLGYQAAKHVVEQNCAKLILAVRSLPKGEATKRSITTSSQCNPATIEVWPLDLSSYTSVQAFAARANTDLARIDVLLENAGIASAAWNWSEDNERMVTVNVVSNFLLAFLMLPKLKATAAKYGTTPRLTFVVSDTQYFIDFAERNAEEGVFNRLNDQEKSLQSMAERYAATKLMEVFLLRELAERVGTKEDTPVIINGTNPGMCKSDLAREPVGLGFKVAKAVLARGVEEGSRNLVAGAVGGRDTHGEYLDLGKVTKPASLVLGEEGMEIQKKLYGELVDKLEKIAPGVSTGF